MKLLLHACCGPCACYPTEQLTAAGTDFDILFFNPNIHPYKEFKHRLSTLREFCEKKRYNLIIDKSYPIEECIRGMLSEPTVRCAFCYRMRLRYAAQFAKENGYDAFSTTLLVSPYQRHELIKKGGGGGSGGVRYSVLLRGFPRRLPARRGYQPGAGAVSPAVLRLCLQRA